MSQELWQVVEKPGYEGKRKDQNQLSRNQQYGEDNWRYSWQLADGQVLDYLGIIWKIYIPGYTKYFHQHPMEAARITDKYAYGYDIDLCTKEQAFDPYALYNVPGRPNQFHHVAFNMALEWGYGRAFRGNEPLQVRAGKPETDTKTWPSGWYWHPGRIPAPRPDLIPQPAIKGWWNPNSIEDVYQSAKVIEVRQS